MSALYGRNPEAAVPEPGPPRLRVAVCHPHMQRGGSEVVAMHALQALHEEYRVSLVTMGRVDLHALDEWSGTSIAGKDIGVLSGRVPPLLRRVTGGDALWGAFYQRFCRVVAPEFDVMLSAYNPCDFGIPGIHLIADFSWDDDVRGLLDRPPRRGLRSRFHRPGLTRRTYRALVRAVARPSGRDLFSGADLILSNSKWSAAILAKRHGLETDVLYPPVPFEAPEVPWAERSVGFATIGRVSPEKRIDQLMDVLKAVRARGHDAQMHVAGEYSTSEYGREMAARAPTEGDWIVFAGEVVGARKVDFLTHQKFGIHGRSGEPFGIAVAEMVKAGCVVFVPSSGGQAEIVSHPALLFDDTDDAVRKIDHVLRSPALCDEVRASLALSADRFSSNRFAEGLRSAVRDFAGRRGARS